MTEVSDRQDRLRDLLSKRVAAARSGPAGIPRGRADGALSPVQRRMWLAGEAEPDSPAYNVPVVVRLRGPLDIPALEGAIGDLVSRHEVFRSLIESHDGEPRAVPGPGPVVERRRIRAADLDGQLADLVGRPFRLAVEIPIRPVILELEPQDQVLVLMLHHTAVDAESLHPLLRELAALYRFRTGTGPALETPPMQYGDAAAWLNEQARSPEAERSLAWWSQRLEGLTCEPVPPGWRGAEVELDLDAEAVRVFAEQHGASVFMVLLAALQLLVARVTDSTDVAVGTPEAGRRHPDLEQLLGCFIETLVLRTSIDEESTGAEVLERVRAEVLDSLGHANVPFDRIVRPGTPLFDVLLNVVEPAPALHGFPGVDAEVVDVPMSAVKFPQTWTFTDDGTTLRGRLAYRTDLYDEDTARRLAGWFTALLTQLVTEPGRPVGLLELEPGADHVRTRTSPVSDPRTVPARIADQDPAATAVVAADGSLTYGELNDRAARLAGRLSELGIGPGDRVGILLERTSDLPVALLAVLRAGAAYVPVDESTPARRAAVMLAGVRVAISTHDLAERLPPTVTLVPPDASGTGTLRPAAPDDLAYVIFTSGSTGTPKQVPVEHRQLTAYLDAVATRVGPVGSAALVSTIAADLGLLNVYGALTTGGTLHLLDRETATDPVAFAAHRVDVLKCVPSQLELLASHGDLGSVLPRRLLVLAGEAAPWSLVDRIAEVRPDLEVQVHYGPTETTVSVLGCTAAAMPRLTAHVPLGTPFPGVSCFVADRAGRPVPDGIPGELYIGGPQVARGYGPFHRSGDRARIRPDGAVEFLGRIDDQVKIRGHRVEPGEVAAACRALPGVTEAVVLPAGRGLAAWLVGSGTDGAQVRRVLRRSLPDHMVPASVTFLDALPLTANGKVDRARLPQPHDEPSRPPSSAAELLVAEVWTDLLGLDGVGTDDDFFTLGGDSFTAVRAAGRLSEGLGARVPVRLLFDRPVLAELAAGLETLTGTSDGPIPRRTGTGPWPLTPVQRRLWLAGEKEPDSPAYNVPVVLRLRGELQVGALRDAVAGLVLRHEVLSSRVVLIDGEPRGVTGDPGEFSAEVPGDLDARIAELSAVPFRLADEPPFRATLLTVGPRDHVLVLVLHHLVSDAWSRGILMRDLADLYAAETGDRPAPPPLELRFADVAEWTDGPPDPGWWAEHLAGLEPELDLSADHRPGAAAVGLVELDLTDDLAAGVRAFAADHGATVFLVLLAVLQTVLARVSGSTDIAVGVPEAGRRHRDTEALVGCFLDTLTLRAQVDGELTAGELLGQARAEMLEAFAHAGEPYEPPPLQVLLNLYQAPAPVTGFPGLQAEMLETPPLAAKFDLSWTIQDDGAGLSGALTYRSEMFEEATARRFAGFFLAVLEQFVTSPDRPVGEFDLDPGADPVLSGGPEPAAKGPACLHERIGRQAALTPEATAVTASDGSHTYAELDRLASLLAGRLQAAGVEQGDRVAVLLERTRDLPVALLGVLRAGAAFVPVDDAAPADRIAGMLATAEVRVAVTTADLADRVPADVRTVLPAGDLPHRVVAVRPADLAYVIFTSGSTGTPKGVAVEHRNIVGYLDGVLPRVQGAAPLGTWALASTIAADLGLLTVFGALTTGGTLELLDRDTATDPVAFAARQADFLKCVPSHLELLASHGDLGSVLPRRLLVLAGEAVPWSLVDRIAEVRPDLEVQVHYGPTETTVAVLTCSTRDVARASAYVPLGRPLPGVRCFTADAAGRALPHGVAGELWIGGPQVARGYLGTAGFTDGLYRTGDRVRVRPDGVVEFLGRIDDQVKIRGYRVEPGEVAAVCRDLPGVTEAVVLPVGEGTGRRLAAWLVAKGLDAAEIRTALRDRLPDYMVPSTITFLDTLPLTANGKIDRRRLPLDAADPAVKVEPASEAERLIAEVWAQLLGTESVGATDDFFALGGDSFTAVKAVQAIDQGLRVIDLFTHPTVRELAAHLASRTPGGGALLHRLGGPRSGTPAVTIVCVPYGGGSAAVYRPLAEAMPPEAEILALELPGHDPARPDEEPESVERLVERCVTELAERSTGPIAVYGHCVGTALATAVALRLEETGAEVAGVFLGGSFPTARLPGRFSAWFNRRLPADRWLSDRAYRDVLRAMGGLPDDLEGAAVDTAVNAIRHDARTAQDWFTRRLGDPSAGRLRAPVLVVVGGSDGATDLYEERYREWETFADDVELAVIPQAGHYFLRHQAPELAAVIEKRLAGPAARPRAAEPVRPALRGFYTVAVGQLVSMVGSSLSSFALGVWTYQQSGRVLDFALVTMLALLPSVLAGPVGGAVADRYDRRRVMFACDALSGAGMAAIAVLLWQGRLGFAAVCLVVTLMSVVSAFHRPAYLAAIAQLVPKPYLPQANAFAQAGLGLGTLVAPLAGGVLIAMAGLPLVIAVDVVTFVVSLATLLAVPFPDRLFRRREETFRAAMGGGWRFMVRRPPLMIMAGYFMVVNYFTALTLAVVSPMVLSLGGAAELGVVTAAGGLGAVVGGLVMIAWGGTRRLADGMVGFVVVAGLATVLTGLSGVVSIVPLIAFGLAARWGATSVINAHWLAIIQLKVRMELQGRVLATNQMLATVMTPVGYLSAAPLAAGAAALTGEGRGVSLGWLLGAMGVLLTVWGAWGLRLRRLRFLEDELPDAQPTAEISRDLDELQEEADRLLLFAASGRSL